MNGGSASYDAEQLEGATDYTTRARMNFKLLANGTCQPDVTIESQMPAFPSDEMLVQMTALNSKVLTIATLLGRRWEMVYKHTKAAEPTLDDDATLVMPEQEEIEGWLVRRTT
jgi:hypothetical protein